MSPELISILTIGVLLGGGQLATVLWVADRFERIGEQLADLRGQLTRLEGPLDRLRDAVSGRRETV